MHVFLFGGPAHHPPALCGACFEVSRCAMAEHRTPVIDAAFRVLKVRGMLRKWWRWAEIWAPATRSRGQAPVGRSSRLSPSAVPLPAAGWRPWTTTGAIHFADCTFCVVLLFLCVFAALWCFVGGLLVVWAVGVFVVACGLWVGGVCFGVCRVRWWRCCSARLRAPRRSLL